jgi:hypothetical protein
LALDIGKSLKLALIPIVVIIVLGIISLGMSFILNLVPLIGAIMCVIGPGIMLLDCIVLGWAGFKAAKAGMDIVGGAITGGLTGFITSLVLGVIGLVLNFLGLGVNVATGGDVGTAVLGAGFSLIGGVIVIGVSVVIWTVVGLVLGAIGTVAAGMKK